jgi:hypothetical protein
MKTGMEPQFTRGLSIKIHQTFGFNPDFYGTSMDFQTEFSYRF